jgi:hypothetical protein
VGDRLVNAVLQTSEKLFIVVTADQRDAIQETVRGLQQQWESCEDDTAVGVDTAVRMLKYSKELERRYSDISNWLRGFRQKLQPNDQMLLNSLSEKKNAVRLHSVCVCMYSSHTSAVVQVNVVRAK